MANRRNIIENYRPIVKEKIKNICSISLVVCMFVSAFFFILLPISGELPPAAVQAFSGNFPIDRVYTTHTHTPTRNHLFTLFKLALVFDTLNVTSKWIDSNGIENPFNRNRCQSNERHSWKCNRCILIAFWPRSIRPCHRIKHPNHTTVSLSLCVCACVCVDGFLSSNFSSCHFSFVQF